MTHPRFFGEDPKILRDLLRETRESARIYLICESHLIEHLRQVDNRRLYVRVGFNSLTGYCRHALKISRTQTQRLVTAVRRNHFGASDNA